MTTATQFAEHFSPEHYAISHGVAVLDEHERADGTYVGRDELQTMVDTLNARIEDTGDYVPLTLGHTPDDPGLPDPPVIGYAGPYKLSMLGATKPRWAIFAENWAIDRNREDEARRNPRRSVELYLDAKTKKPLYFDPIALLGATAPRRSLGLKLSTKGDGSVIKELYEMGGGSSSPPKKTEQGQDQGKPNPANPANPAQQQQQRTALNDIPLSGDDALAAKILAALEQTDVFSWVRTKMAEDATRAAATANDPMAQQGADPNQLGQPGKPGDVGQGNDVNGFKGQKPNSNQPGTPPGKPGKEQKMSANSEKEGYELRGEVDKYKAEVDKYKLELDATKAELEATKAEHKSIGDRLAGLEKDKLRAERKNVLRDMADKGIVFDLAEATADVADVSNEEFDRYCKLLDKHATRVPVGHVLPQAEVDKLKAGEKDLEKRQSDVEKAKDLVVKENYKISFADAMKRVTSGAA